MTEPTIIILSSLAVIVLLTASLVGLTMYFISRTTELMKLLKSNNIQEYIYAKESEQTPRFQSEEQPEEQSSVIDIQSIDLRDVKQ